jgi:hypothetical protein
VRTERPSKDRPVVGQWPADRTAVRGVRRARADDPRGSSERGPFARTNDQRRACRTDARSRRTSNGRASARPSREGQDRAVGPGRTSDRGVQHDGASSTPSSRPWRPGRTSRGERAGRDRGSPGRSDVRRSSAFSTDRVGKSARARERGCVQVGPSAGANVAAQYGRPGAVRAVARERPATTERPAGCRALSASVRPGRRSERARWSRTNDRCQDRRSSSRSWEDASSSAALRGRWMWGAVARLWGGREQGVRTS